MLTFPNCKINIGLYITDKRSDGFHSIETAMVPISWTDILEIIPDKKSENSFDIKCTGVRVFGAKERNLCTHAYNLLCERSPLPSVKAHLHKMLPVGAGLGGGSSDAAHTLILLNKLFRLNLSEKELLELAAKLGSDCAFFINNKPMLATGRGDVLEPLKIKLKELYCIIIKPKVHISTANAYSWVKPQKRKTSLMDLLQAPVSEWKDTIENDFEKVVFERYPVIKNIKARLYKLGAVYASMSGSGSSVYGLFKEEKHLDTYFRSCTVWSGSISSLK